jgi:hypothetical protein
MREQQDGCSYKAFVFIVFRLFLGLRLSGRSLFLSIFLNNILLFNQQNHTYKGKQCIED